MSTETVLEHAEATPVTLLNDLASKPPQRELAPMSTPGDLLRLAVVQGADLDRLERLMALQERWETNNARKEYSLAMARFKEEPLEIFRRKQVGYKTKEGDFVGYTHAELCDVTDVVGPAMAKHDLSYRWNIKQEPSRVVVSCIVTHKLGHSESVTMDAPPDNSGKKNAIQQIASTVTYLSRYTLLAVTGMSTKGMDDDGEGAGDADAEERRTQWLIDQKANIAEARNGEELNKIMDYALAKARENNDDDALAQLVEAGNAKKATAKPSRAREGATA